MERERWTLETLLDGRSTLSHQCWNGTTWETASRLKYLGIGHTRWWLRLVRQVLPSLRPYELLQQPDDARPVDDTPEARNV